MIEPDRELDLALDSIGKKVEKVDTSKTKTESVVKNDNPPKVKEGVTSNKSENKKTVEDKWEQSQRQRQHHFNGVKPIMDCVDIKEPLNLVLLYFLTIILVWYFLVKKIIQATAVQLIKIANDCNRSKPIRIFAWGILGVVTFLILLTLTCLLIKWLI